MKRRFENIISLKSAIGWGCLFLVFAIGLSFYKTAQMERFSKECAQTLQARHTTVLNLFQGSYFFYYDEQFLPGVQENIKKTPSLERIQILTSGGVLLFDSVEPSKGPVNGESGNATKAPVDKGILSALRNTVPSVFVSGYRVQVLVPAGQYGILYSFHGPGVRNQIAILLVSGILTLLLLGWAVSRISRIRLASGKSFWSQFLGLRSKFLFTIVLINVITGLIVFFTLTELQTREQSVRIERESILFSRFSTAQIVSDFSNYFYFYYNDRFLPDIKTIIATNENLLGIRIISKRTGSVLFDSELASSSSNASAVVAELPRVRFSPEVENDLKIRGMATQKIQRGREEIFSVINTYRNENQEALFNIEFLFSFQSLAKSIEGIRRQIMLDLIPALALGLLIAIIFSQFLISPIRRLAAALKRVTEGNFDVSVEARRSDEIGDLISAFNTMTIELRKKQELRKYLSDSTYRQIMESANGSINAKMGGSKVSATVLFSDIRNFVAHCESLEAEEVTAMLNEYFSEMVEVVYKHGGEVDKFIGDALLAVFYTSDQKTPSSRAAATSTALQAIYCAIEMRERLKEFNERRIAQQKNTIEIGIGLSYGEIISGPIGSKDRMDFTVIGDVVNIANRIEKISKLGKHTRIVFSNHIEDKVRGLLDYEVIPHDPIRGKEEEISVFELVRIRDLKALAENLHGKDQELRLRSVELLGESRNHSAVPHVIECLNDDDEQMRLRAVFALGRLVSKDDPVILDNFFERLKVEKSDKVLGGLISVMGQICTDERILKLAPYLDSNDERIVANTIESMGKIRSPKCNDLILPKLASRNNRVKANAAMALFAAGRIEVIDTLKPMLMHSDPLMRSSAAFAIGELSMLTQKDRLIETWKSRTNEIKLFLAELQESVPMLVTLLKDPEPMVKRQAIIALGKIKDKTAVLPMINSIDISKDTSEMLEDVSLALRSIGSHKLVREVISRLSGI